MQSIARLATFFLAAACGISAIAAERFTNGDFEAGASGFTSDYSYNGVDNSAAGSFAVTSNPNNVHGSWGIFDDHTVAGTLMMTANGTTTAGLAVWRETVAVVPGRRLHFFGVGCEHLLSESGAAELSRERRPVCNAATSIGRASLDEWNDRRQRRRQHLH
jgi:hypothetical protein